MSMISEIIEELIDNADLYTKELHDLMYRAADTIAMLSEKARADRPQGERICGQVIIRNEGGYFGTIEEEVVEPKVIKELRDATDCHRLDEPQTERSE